ncbi:hypothetical protein A0H81_03958 [Grifola frondosa]|uniref:Uncharacterized protein n=1 Tax=Grifola frondosa TaxID=5627 RepID=A0A1C7MIU5_GRIFR|nr:hypothetical protein A0H81_03958 [Grifola frondosa]
MRSDRLSGAWHVFRSVLLTTLDGGTLRDSVLLVVPMILARQRRTLPVILQQQRFTIGTQVFYLMLSRHVAFRQSIIHNLRSITGISAALQAPHKNTSPYQFNRKNPRKGQSMRLAWRLGKCFSYDNSMAANATLLLTSDDDNVK